ncbi:MAG: hypothetical protein U5R14_06095 [Gemmatimonadota bacterium]|nr:hypothetical protein [Gemmatimonadota bacterium]
MYRTRSGLTAVFCCLGLASLAIEKPTVSRSPELVIERVAELRDGSESILARPWEVVERLDSSFWVVDFSDRNIKVYSHGGHRLRTIGSAGRGPGQFGTVLSVFPMERGVGAYDFLDSQLVLLDNLGSEISRTSLVQDRRARQPIAIRYLGPDRLLAVYQSATDGAGLLEVIDFQGSVEASFMALSEWYRTNPAIESAERILADAFDGCIFAASTFSDSLRAFDYEGRQLAAGVWDPSERWPDVPNRQSTLAEDRPHVRSVVALPGCRALVQVRTAEMGNQESVRWNPLEGGEIALFAPAPPNLLHRIASIRLADAGLLGRDREGRGLVLRNPSDAHDPFVLLRILDTGS